MLPHWSTSSLKFEGVEGLRGKEDIERIKVRMQLIRDPHGRTGGKKIERIKVRLYYPFHTSAASNLLKRHLNIHVPLPRNVLFFYASSFFLLYYAPILAVYLT
jgi:hypothetical protein